eukprot:gnl/Dysnectes_brevis/5105_a7202_291.p1 GENE.gnl/Dysnectes_brevis/5105_a7202_291~~gnl/Dysnectes_brevis/5105_a7202_291.p1  ORF type:complete len:1014 (+),score=244.20 gnl/Dysnectes_brevis/5105_a7202_291:99-3140(+)
MEAGSDKASDVPQYNVILKLLVSHKLDLVFSIPDLAKHIQEIKDDDGSTLIHAAVLAEAPKAIYRFSRMGLSPNDCNNRHETPLHLAAELNLPICVSELIGCRADINIRDIDGFTPLHLACLYGSQKALVTLLQSRKVTKNPVDNHEWNPIHFCAVRTALHLALSSDPSPALCPARPGHPHITPIPMPPRQHEMRQEALGCILRLCRELPGYSSLFSLEDDRGCTPLLSAVLGGGDDAEGVGCLRAVLETSRELGRFRGVHVSGNYPSSDRSGELICASLRRRLKEARLLPHPAILSASLGHSMKMRMLFEDCSAEDFRSILNELEQEGDESLAYSVRVFKQITNELAMDCCAAAIMGGDTGTLNDALSLTDIVQLPALATLATIVNAPSCLLTVGRKAEPHQARAILSEPCLSTWPLSFRSLSPASHLQPLVPLLRYLDQLRSAVECDQIDGWNPSSQPHMPSTPKHTTRAGGASHDPEDEHPWPCALVHLLSLYRWHHPIRVLGDRIHGGSLALDSQAAVRRRRTVGAAAAARDSQDNVSFHYLAAGPRGVRSGLFRGHSGHSGHGTPSRRKSLRHELSGSMSSMHGTMATPSTLEGGRGTPVIHGIDEDESSDLNLLPPSCSFVFRAFVDRMMPSTLQGITALLSERVRMHTHPESSEEDQDELDTAVLAAASFDLLTAHEASDPGDRPPSPHLHVTTPGPDDAGTQEKEKERYPEWSTTVLEQDTPELAGRVICALRVWLLSLADTLRDQDVEANPRAPDREQVMAQGARRQNQAEETFCSTLLCLQRLGTGLSGNINARNSMGLSPILLSCAFGSPTDVACLVAAGADSGCHPAPLAFVAQRAHADPSPDTLRESLAIAAILIAVDTPPADAAEMFPPPVVPMLRLLIAEAGKSWEGGIKLDIRRLLGLDEDMSSESPRHANLPRLQMRGSQGGATHDQVSARPKWDETDSVDRCAECFKKFSVFRRKHHCYSCGRVLCSGCCNIFMDLPDLGYRNVRACQTCFSERS